MQILCTFTHKNLVDSLKNEGNFKDNVKYTKEYTFHYKVKLSEEEFFDLCFLGNEETASITSNGRKLRTAAQSALSSIKKGATHLSGNWNLSEIETKTKAFLANGQAEFAPITLRDAKGGELKHKCNFYIQDGNHRCLGYAMHLLSAPGLRYMPIEASLSTNKALE